MGKIDGLEFGTDWLLTGGILIIFEKMLPVPLPSYIRAQYLWITIKVHQLEVYANKQHQD